MHGLTTPKEVFDDLTEQLVSKDFQVLAFDFYGRGMSDHIQPIESEKVYVDQVYLISLCKHLWLDRFRNEALELY